MAYNTPGDNSPAHHCDDHTSQGGIFQDWVADGEAAFESGDLQEAEKCFEKAIEQAPFDAKAYSNLSVVYWRQGNIEKALNKLMHALELDPDDQDVIMNCIEIFQQLGRIEDAREIGEAYLAKKPWDYEIKRRIESLVAPCSVTQLCQSAQTMPAPVSITSGAADLFNEQGEKQFAQGRMGHAQVCFEIALENDPDNARAHSNLGVVFWREGILEKALEHLYKAAELAPQDSDVRYNCARVLEAAGYFDIAVDYMRVYLQLNPRDETAWEEYSSLIRAAHVASWSHRGSPVEAGDIYLRMGRELREAGDFIGAGEALHRALQLNPQQASIYYELGKTHQAMGDSPEAISMFGETLRRDAGHKAAALALGEILSSEGRVVDARSVLQDYLAGNDDQEIQEVLRALQSVLGT